VLTTAGALCLAATGTAAAVTWAAPSASPARAADMVSFHSLTLTQPARPAQLAPQGDLARRAVLIWTADRAAAAHAAAEARAAARRAAAARAAAERAERRRAAQQAAAQPAATETAVARVPSGTPQRIAELMLVPFGWSGQFSCLSALWGQESGWNVSAENPSSGAYGIPQALPGSKMAAAGANWQTDAATQIGWGLGYIRASYGSPCAAWGHEEAAGWY